MPYPIDLSKSYKSACYLQWLPVSHIPRQTEKGLPVYLPPGKLWG